MYLLIHRPDIDCECCDNDLHPTMYLLILILPVLLIKEKSHLHPTMYLLILSKALYRKWC